jgi:hypothetical protein
LTSPCEETAPAGDTGAVFLGRQSAGRGGWAVRGVISACAGRRRDCGDFQYVAVDRGSFNAKARLVRVGRPRMGRAATQGYLGFTWRSSNSSIMPCASWIPVVRRTNFAALRRQRVGGLFMPGAQADGSILNQRCQSAIGLGGIRVSPSRPTGTLGCSHRLQQGSAHVVEMPTWRGGVTRWQRRQWQSVTTGKAGQECPGVRAGVRRVQRSARPR